MISFSWVCLLVSVQCGNFGVEVGACPFYLKPASCLMFLLYLKHGSDLGGVVGGGDLLTGVVGVNCPLKVFRAWDRASVTWGLGCGWLSSRCLIL